MTSETGVNTFTAKGLEKDKSYVFYVKARQGWLQSDWSRSVHVTISTPPIIYKDDIDGMFLNAMFLLIKCFCLYYRYGQSVLFKVNIGGGVCTPYIHEHLLRWVFVGMIPKRNKKWLLSFLY